MISLKNLKNLKNLAAEAAAIAADPKAARGRAAYAAAYAATITAITAALSSSAAAPAAPAAPPWTEGRCGEDTMQGVLDAVEDAERGGIHALCVFYGSRSDSCGAYEASDPANWRGWPIHLLRGKSPAEAARAWGLRPTEVGFAVSSARWVADDPLRRGNARPALRGHIGRCSYVTLWVA